MSQRKSGPNIDSAKAVERAERLLANGLQSGAVRGRGGPAQRSRGAGRRKKNARHAIASSVVSDDKARPRSTIAHKISLSASSR
ncbi:hypothetical protein QCE48_17780 [Caballeronia sp. LZ024]|nr:hypothetical protein [Caballeronia sp. LZ024]MDR5841631.1 hypothetical protein [Caballeronia sp. LZ031]